MELEDFVKGAFSLKQPPLYSAEPFLSAADQTPEFPAVVKAQCIVVSQFCRLQNDDGCT